MITDNSNAPQKNLWKITAVASWIFTVIFVTGVTALNIYYIDYLFDLEPLIDERKAKKMQRAEVYEPVAIEMAKYCHDTDSEKDIVLYLEKFSKRIDGLKFNRGEFSPTWAYLEKRSLINNTYTLKLDESFVDESKSRWQLYFESDVEDWRLLYTFEIDKKEAIKARERLPGEELTWQ